MTEKEAKALVNDLSKWKVRHATEMTRVLFLKRKDATYIRIQALFPPNTFLKETEPKWMDVWTGSYDRDWFVANQQMTLNHIARLIWKEGK